MLLIQKFEGLCKQEFIINGQKSNELDENIKTFLLWRNEFRYKDMKRLASHRMMIRSVCLCIIHSSNY